MPSLSQISGDVAAMYIVWFAVTVTGLFSIYTGLMTETFRNVLVGAALLILNAWFIYNIRKEEADT